MVWNGVTIHFVRAECAQQNGNYDLSSLCCSVSNWRLCLSLYHLLSSWRCLWDSASVTSAIALLDYRIRWDILATLIMVFHRIHLQHWLSYFIGYTRNIDGRIHTYIHTSPEPHHTYHLCGACSGSPQLFVLACKPKRRATASHCCFFNVWCQ